MINSNSTINILGAVREKRSYTSPALIRYGSLNDLTRNSNQSQGNDNAVDPGKRTN
jgi:hypothetical protein